jgi:hypothetical protein
MALATPVTVQRSRLAILATLTALVAPGPAFAQTGSRFAAGGEFTIRTSDRAPTEDYAHSQIQIEPLWRFGTTESGWGFHWGLNWYAVDVDRPVGGAVTELGEIHIRPVMAGWGYTHVINKSAITVDLLGGYAFSSMSMTGAAVDAYRLRAGVQSVDADATNTFVLKPEIALWYDINAKLGLNINAGYMMARPDVTIRTNAGLDRRTARADQFILKIGLAYSIF